MSTVQITEDRTYVFKATDFTTGTFAGVKITSLPTTGTLMLSGVPVTLNQIIKPADVSAGNFTFVPNTDVTAAGSFNDVVGTTNSTGSMTTTSGTTTLNVTADGGPSALASSVQVTANTTYTFAVGDFGYSDAGDKTADPMGSVVITSLPTNGTLQLNGAAVTLNQSISSSQISASQLTFVPNANATTGTFSFKVTDTATGGVSATSAAAATMTLNIGGTTTDPGPTTSAHTVQVMEDVTYTFATADFPYSDSFDPTDPLKSVTIISLPTTGTLQLNGVNVNAGQSIAAGSIPSLKFVPNLDVTAQGSFSFSVTDTTGNMASAPATMTLNVTADGGPSALASSITATENQTYTFKTADFGYSDNADKTVDPLASVIVTSLPSDGTLKLNGNAVTANQSITAAQISGGLLTFVPNTNVTTAGSFQFKVTDTATGGVSATSATAATMSINIAVPGSTQTPAPQLSFAAQNFNTVGSDNSGFYMIPPDSNAAVGGNTVITATNGVIEAFNKSGAALSIFNGSNNESLNSFFVAGLGDASKGGIVFTNFNDPNQSGPFDPKVIYDTNTQRFIVVSLQESDAGGSFNDKNTSSILVAVSSPDTGAPLTWSYTSINSDVITANGADCWADYPGLATDGTNIYVTANLFDHATGNYQGSRLWTLPFSPSTTNASQVTFGSSHIYDPSTASGATAAGSSELFTLMPSQMLSNLPGGGVFLVSYSGARNSQGELLNVIEVSNPQAANGPTFTYQQIGVGNIDSAGAFSAFTAPQKGTTTRIDAGDDRVYSVVFRNGYLYAATTINPTSSYDAANAGKTTAHWFQINATNPSSLTLMQQGDVSGASIASGVRTYYPSITVDANGDFAIGFSASGPNNYASAYYEAYKYNATSNTWTLENPTLLAGGVAPYVRTFGGSDNRWGDFSSIVPDPSNPSTFWVYNEYAWTQGTTISGENGRWATQVGEFTLPNTITGPVVASGGAASIPPAGSANPSTSNPISAQLALAEGFRHGRTSDINANANPLVEGDHGPGLGSTASQVAENWSQAGDFDDRLAGRDTNGRGNVLVDSEHGPALGSLPAHDPGNASLQQWPPAASVSQLVQTMAAFRATHEGIAVVSDTSTNDPTNPGVLAANFFNHHG